MPFRISLSDDSSYIILEVTGEITRQNAMQHNLEAHKLGREKGIKKYLVDCTNARNVDSVLNNYQFAYSDMRHTEGIDITAIVAAVVAPEDHSHDFIETAARNSGLNLTLFRNKQKAVEFLKSQ
jgi:hypothetical protein